MSKIAVVFWSGTGNTETMAGAEVEEVQAADFSADALAGFDAVAFGCPAMGDEALEACRALGAALA